MTPRRVIMGLALAVTASLPASAQTPPASPARPAAPALRLADLEARVLASHPAIREAAARLEEARGQQRQAAAWANPVVGVTADELRPREAPSGVFGGFVQQEISLGGKRANARAVAAADVTVGEAAVDAARKRVTTALRVAYYATLAAEERLSVATRLATLGHEMLAVSRQLFNVGIADRPDVLAAEAEAATLDAQLTAARAARVGAWRRLAAAAGEPALTPQPLAEQLTDALAPLDANAERTRILDGSPELKAAAAAVARARAAVGVERSRVRPDLFLRGDAAWNREPIHSGRATGWQFGVEAGLSLPLANRNAGGLAASLAAVRVAEAVEATTRLAIEARWASAVEEVEAARALAEAYRTEILPRSEQAYELYLSKYREMAAPYPQVLMAQRTLIEQHEQYVGALERAWRAALRLQGFVPDGM